METIKLLTMAEVSDALRIPVNTLRYYRHLGKGPKAAKYAGRIMYREQDVIDWVNAAFEQAD
ncbi:DNA-binding transcriptional MerR regulator [Paenarthrobacter nicotinovorans]|uniref:helix-turn-helix domain-containing protein n=1 Tax=Micrococcaceae TaxID=1268 RepID=UPI000876B9CD|nr:MULTISPECIES: helix-turn-helix domain-containing protein [Micrococcaceae]MDR6439083.1 DNA-binding transcriptional MerR regulator [Paenarthrobacter nicotinovorans]SCZ65303.1 Helix-turn-helix domain-containing protein [Arthrobacter sp. UNCCL28]